MSLDINLWRFQIGVFTGNTKYISTKKTFLSNYYPCLSIKLFLFLLILFTLQCKATVFLYVFLNGLYSIDLLFLFIFQHFLTFKLLLRSGDIETQPGPRSKNSLSVCHFNINSLSAHNFAKLSSLKAFNSVHNFDIICLSESFLDSSFHSGNPDLAMNGYELVRADHPLDIKRGGVCLYYKETLPIKICNINNLSECLLCEISFNNQKCFIISLYRSPSQSSNEFNIFLKELEVIIDNICTPGNSDLVIIIGDFNAKLSIWNLDDSDSTEGTEISAMTSSYGFTQIISEATHILPNSSSCIDLLFTNQPNMITSSGVLPSIHPNCHHQIIYANINFQVFFPPPYERQVWHFDRADCESIKQSISNIDWNRIFLDMDVNLQVETFNEYLMNILKNFIPNEIIEINDKDPPWITKAIKNKIDKKNQLYRRYLQGGKLFSDLEVVNDLTICINEMILASKNCYYDRLSKKLNDPKTSPKAYWSILKSFFGDKKVPIIPPLLYNDKYISDFKAKAELFNNHFSEQCSLIPNSSSLPDVMSGPLPYPSLSSFTIDADKLLNLIRSLDINKSHGYDQISVRMLKICDSSLIKPLLIIFNNSLNSGMFPSAWKKANIIPIHKKGDKMDVKNYRPISLLPICGKLFEKVIYNTLYKYYESNDILNVNQSGFRQGDSCINQLINITHDVFQSFDSNPPLEVRGVFLDISKAFDRVWHKGLLFKLKSNGIEGNLFNLIESFLCNRLQRVVLNGQNSKWEKIAAGVPKGSILGPLLFLIYINDISDNLESNVKLFADDTSIFSVVLDPNLSATQLNNDLQKIQQWAYQWKMIFNPAPSKQAQEVIFSRKNAKPFHPNLIFNQSNVIRTSSQKHLGLILDEKLNFKEHIKILIEKSSKGISVIRKLRYQISRHSLVTLYKSFIRSILEYADVIYDQPSNDSFSDKIESIQYNAALAITGAIRGTSKDKLYKELGLEYLSSRRWLKRLCLFHKIYHNKSPEYLYRLIPQPHNLFNLRNQHLIPQIFCRTNLFSDSFFPTAIKEFNKLNYQTTHDLSFQCFRKTLSKSIRPVPNSLFDACNPHGVKLLTRLRVGLSHLREQKFRHGFNDTIDPFCPCNMETESVSHFFLRCLNYSNLRLELMNELMEINSNLVQYNEEKLTETLLYGDKNLSHDTNSKIINLSISFIIKSSRFDGPLL